MFLEEVLAGTRCYSRMRHALLPRSNREASTWRIVSLWHWYLLSSIGGPRHRAARRRNWGRVCIRGFCLRRRLVPAAHRAALLLSGSAAVAAFHDTGGARSRCARVARGGATAREADDRRWHGARRPGAS